MRLMILVVVLASASPVFAEEGMWTFDNFPADIVRQTHGAEVTGAWLDRVRLSTLRLTNCTASFVSSEGLILTNHHCVESCLAELSSKDNGLIDRGFLAPDKAAERRCSTQLADVLVSMDDVTAKVAEAIHGSMTSRPMTRARKSSPNSNKLANREAPKPDRPSSNARLSRYMMVDKFSYISTRDTTTFDWSSHPRRISPHSAATRITFNSRAGPWISPYCGPTSMANRPRPRRIS